MRPICLLISGLLLLTAPGCISRPATETAAAPEPRVVVRTVRDTPPAALLECPVVPVITVEAGGQLPREKRVEIYGLASAYRDNTQRLLRLLAWVKPGSCGTAADDAPPGPALSPPE